MLLFDAMLALSQVFPGYGTADAVLAEDPYLIEWFLAVIRAMREQGNG